MQVLSQTHWLTQLLDLEVRDGNVAHLRGSDGPGPSCTSSCSTLSELDNCDSGVSSLLEGENHEEYTVTEPINVIMGPGIILIMQHEFIIYFPIKFCKIILLL